MSTNWSRQVYPDHVDYNGLPWKFAAGTGNILGTIASAQDLRLLLVELHPDGYEDFGSERALSPRIASRAV